MSNIKDIADKAGVSVTTVSRVINNHPYVSEEKRKRVLEAMEVLEYTRNVHAVHLSKGFSNMIGVVMPTIGLPYFAELMAGISDAAAESGIHLSLFQTNYDVKKEIFALSQLKQRQVDGLIFARRRCLMTSSRSGKGRYCFVRIQTRAGFPQSAFLIKPHSGTDSTI